MERFLSTEALVIKLLLIAALVAIMARRLRVPYTVALVVAGLLTTYQQAVKIELTPELIMAVFVPPLVFEAAFHIQLRELRDNLLPILLLTVPGVLLTTLVVGLIVATGVQIPLASGFLFGALISATDPVAVVAVFRTLNVPRRLAVLIEGESLLNDGTAVVVFNLILAAALPLAVAGGAAPPAAPDLLSAAVEFVRVSAGGLVVGLGLGWLTAQVIARLDDYLIETALTTVLAFGAYLVAEEWHVSGVLAVVGAGLVNGNLGPRGMSPTTRVVLFNFWEYVAFVVNSLVFLIIGSQVNLPQLAAHPGPIAVGLLAVLAGRALVVYGLGWLINRRRRHLPGAYQHVLFWGGLRGAISLALVLSLPPEFADRELLRVMAFGVVLFLLLGQGTTINLLVRRLGLVRHEEGQLEYERRQGRLRAAQAARLRLRQLHDEGLIPATTWERLQPDLDALIGARLDDQKALLRDQPALDAEVLEDARREGLRAQRAALAALFNEGQISEAVYEELVTEVDEQSQADRAARDASEPPVE